MAFPPLGNSDHVVVSVSIDFPLNSQQDAPFHYIACEYSRADGTVFMIIWKDVSWKEVFKLGAFAAASECCECVQVRTDLYIPHHKRPVKPYSSPWFSAACAALISHRITFLFHLYQQNESSESKVKFRQPSNSCKRFFELPNFHMLIKQKSLSFLSNLPFRIFGELVFSTKLNLLYLLYSMAHRCFSFPPNKAKLFPERACLYHSQEEITSETRIYTRSNNHDHFL